MFETKEEEEINSIALTYFFFKDLLVPGFTVTFAVLRCFIRKCTQRTCLAGFKATATSQGENAPACEPSRKFIS